jgi:hypothetical protein
VARRVRGHRGHAVQGVTAVEVVRAVHRAERPGLPAVVEPVDAEPAGRRIAGPTGPGSNTMLRCRWRSR